MSRIVENAIQEHLKKQGIKEYASVHIYKNNVQIEFEREIEKYVDHRKYHFLFENYDRNIMVEEDDNMTPKTRKEYKNFLLKNQFQLIKPNKRTKVEVSAGVGDKSTLSVSTNYSFEAKENEDILELAKRILKKW